MTNQPDYKQEPKPSDTEQPAESKLDKTRRLLGLDQPKKEVRG